MRLERKNYKRKREKDGGKRKQARKKKYEKERQRKKRQTDRLLKRQINRYREIGIDLDRNIDGKDKEEERKE